MKLDNNIFTDLSKKDVAKLKKYLSKMPTNSLYTQPHIYDLAYPGNKGDYQFYEKVCKGTVLYLGIGTGRILSQIVKNHSKVFGLDCSKEMVSLLKKRFPFINSENLIIGNALNKTAVPLSSFDTIIAPHSFLTQFEANNVLKILQNVKKWLKPNGKFYTDIFSPFHNPTFTTIIDCSKKDNKRKKIQIQTYHIYDHLKQYLSEWTCVKMPNDEIKALEVNLHYYYPNEFERLLKTAGLIIENRWGDFLKKDVSLQTETIVYCTSK